jgi:AraC family transcriptional regulator, melibiose operon regulatory protein
MLKLDPSLTGNWFLEPDQFLAEHHIVEPMPQAHWHDHVELNVICQGGMTYLINGRQVRLQRGAIYCFWAAVPHQVISALENTELVCVYMPFAEFLSLVIASEFKNDLMSGHILTAPTLDAIDILLFQRWAQEWDKANEQTNDILRDEVRIRVRRLAVHAWQSAANDEPVDAEYKRNSRLLADKRMISRVQSMTNFINDEFGNDIGVADIARVSGLHATNATTTFQKVLGISIAQYLRRRRLNHALKLLADTEMTIIEIAFECGYGSLSRFYDAFQKQLSCTPRAYRQRFRS